MIEKDVENRPTIGSKVVSILNQSTSKALLKAQWAIQYFSNLTESLGEYKTEKHEKKSDNTEKAKFKYLIREQESNDQLLSKNTQISEVKFKCKNANPTASKGEDQSKQNAEKHKNKQEKTDEDDDKEDGVKNESNTEQRKTENKASYEAENQKTKIPVDQYKHFIEAKTLDKSIVNLTSEEIKQHLQDPTLYKYGSINYYAVLDYEYQGNYSDHKNYLEDLRSYQIQYPIDIDYKKQTNLCEKQAVKKKTKKQTKPNTNVHRKTVTAQFFNKLNYSDYTERVQNNLIVSKMSFLKKQTTVLPQLEITPPSSTAKEKNNVQIIDNDEWTTVGSKGTEMKFEEIFEAASVKYLPKNLPPGQVITDKTINETTHQYPLMIKINKLPHDKKKQLNHTRTIVAVLSAIQKICKETYIVPREGTGNLPLIKTPTQISMNVGELKMYMELPTEEQQNINSIVARVVI
jgi:hypothetical protein